ncbi:hypothetical protein ACFW95_03425 [Streptomyces sp. NPDC059474]|uniref:hypothetical protein n=1 Tax=unclassified Streptomyces TaxID=2593676 RepID=UPI00340F627D
MTQLFHGMTIPPPSRDRVRALLTSAVEHTVTGGELAGGGSEAQVVDVFQKLTMELAQLAETTPMVIWVDCIPPVSSCCSPMTTRCGGRARPCWPDCSRRAPTHTGSP